MTYTAETLPASSIYEVLDESWSEYSGSIPKPRFFDIGGTGRSLRVDLDRFLGSAGERDLVLIRASTLEETPIGNWTYVNRTGRIEVEVYSKAGRQRLYDVMQEIRRILHLHRHSVEGYQRVRFVSFTEYAEENFNIWIGQITVEATNSAVVAEV